ncbi:MAG: hypothetical protein CML36_02175 [Rhodobacteraceae bacterium]|nr:hypothetical protein [Paracoccaceae bacterium]OUU62526.1 MAG: hypothetical protein CBC22_04365 [Alphaproteobacteria bacterium TMED62]|tara:strand:+ start:9411 stop:10160 length:750 start_codon:yes stop_codon:yes gene_type:complete
MKTKKNIIIFRAKGPLENTYLIDKLKNLNYIVKSYPILKIKKTYHKKIKITSNDIILTTSFYGIYYLSKLTDDRNFYLYSLGKSSSLLAKNLGFKNIIECSGDSVSILNNFISNNKFYKVNKGNIIYAGAKEISFNLPKRLIELGYNVKRYKLYSAETINNFNSNFINLVKRREVLWIILLSSKGAKTFYTNCKKLLNKEDLSNINFACISNKVAKNLNKKYLKIFYPKIPNINYIEKIISNYEKKYGT